MRNTPTSDIVDFFYADFERDGEAAAFAFIGSIYYDPDKSYLYPSWPFMGFSGSVWYVDTEGCTLLETPGFCRVEDGKLVCTDTIDAAVEEDDTAEKRYFYWDATSGTYKKNKPCTEDFLCSNPRKFQIH